MSKKRKSGLSESWLIPPKVPEGGTRPTAADLFCGCGGFSLGVMAAGFDVRIGVDNDPHALLTYAHNLGVPEGVRWVGPPPVDKRGRLNPWWNKEAGRPYTPEESEDQEKGQRWRTLDAYRPKARKYAKRWPRTVRTVVCLDVNTIFGHQLREWAGVEEFDCVFGAPPCQGFSKMGKRRVGDVRDLLVFEFVRLVQELQPKAVAMENVPQWMTKKLPSGVKVSDVYMRLLREPWPTGFERPAPLGAPMLMGNLSEEGPRWWTSAGDWVWRP